MTLAPGTSLLHYRLHDKIGQGGMGEVWRATDTTLDRQVAIKVLPGSFAGDAERLARFQREAKLLASLNHPNIAAVFGLHESGGVRFLAMELAPGENLMERLARGPVPMEEALALALQIAEGLEAAHEHGVIHRDLKPANLVVDAGGTVKILDFGLAKALDRDPTSSDSSRMATVTTPATQAGVILGTAAYMCPEQARGRPVDKRADIWAFGVVLWEMLAGRRLFTGETVSDTLASVLKEHPDPGALPPATPAPVRELLRRCLEKDPKKRLRDIGEARILLAGAPASPGAGPTDASASPEGARARRAAPGIAAGLLVAGLVMGAAAAWLLKPGAGSIEGPSYHLSISLPADKPLGTRLSRPVAISPDGRRLVYVGPSQGSFHLFTRALDSDEIQEIPGTESSIDPFFSPDGASLGFLDATSLIMKRISLGGVAPTTFLDSSSLVGAIWAPDGYIYYTAIGAGAGEKSNALVRIPATGGTPEQLTSAGDGGNQLHAWPELLPGGRTVLYAVVKGLDFGKAEVRALDLETRKEKVLLPNAQLARYVPTGHLVYLQGQTLLAVRFDPRRVKILGNPTAVLTHVLTNPDSGSAAFAFSRDGTLVYVSGTAAPTLSVVVGADREGHTRRLIPEARDYLSLAVSPVGDRVAVAVGDRPGSQDIWVHDLRRGTFARLSEGGSGVWPVWTPDGDWIYFTSAVSADRMTLMRVHSDGSGKPEAVRDLPWFGGARSVSPDGKWLLLDQEKHGNADLVLLPLQGKGEPRPFLATQAKEWDGRFSPDGRLVAYLSDQSGHSEVYVRSFPGPGQAWRIPSEGAEALTWTPDGKELLYLQGTAVMAVAMGSGPDAQPGTPRRLFGFEGAAQSAAGSFGGPDLDVLRDGTIVSIRPLGNASGPRRIEVVLDWFAELQRQVP